MGKGKVVNMKIVVLSDAHGNFYYLKRCLDEIKKIEDVKGKICLGDALGYGAKGIECLELLRSEGFYCLMGNHEAMLLGLIPLDEKKDEVYNISKLRASLSVEVRQYLSLLLPFMVISNGDKEILFVHGNPLDPLNGYLYEDKLDILKGLKKYHTVFMGHTHRPYIKEYDGVRYVNVGSCGMPRDIGNKPSFVIYDIDKDVVELRRIEIKKEYIENNYNDVHPEVKKCLLR